MGRSIQLVSKVSFFTFHKSVHMSIGGFNSYVLLSVCFRSTAERREPSVVPLKTSFSAAGSPLVDGNT